MRCPDPAPPEFTPVDVDFVVDGAVDMSATVVVGIELWFWSTDAAWERRALPFRVKDNGGVNVHGAVDGHDHAVTISVAN